MKPLAFIAALCISASAYAVEPKAVISGPKAAPIGSMVVLDSLGSQYDPGLLIWTVADDKVQALEGVDGKLGLVQGQPGRVCVLLVAIGLVDGKAKAAFTKHVVVFGGQPEPDPKPPLPPVPAPLTPLAQWTLTEATKLPASTKAIMAACGDNFEASASAAAGGILASPAAMQADTAARNLTTEGAQRETCKPFFTALAVQLKSLNLTTLPQHIEAWRDISAGLRGIK